MVKWLGALPSTDKMRLSKILSVDTPEADSVVLNFSGQIDPDSIKGLQTLICPTALYRKNVPIGLLS